MYKVLILSLALFALVAARPGLITADTYETTSFLEPTKVGEVVHSVPSAISHQSQTVVHGSTHVVSDVVAATPVVGATPVVADTVAVLPPSEVSYHGAPLIKSIAAASALATPLVATYAAPVAIYH